MRKGRKLPEQMSLHEDMLGRLGLFLLPVLVPTWIVVGLSMLIYWNLKRGYKWLTQKNHDTEARQSPQ